MPKVLIGLPTYDDTTNARQALFLYLARSDRLDTVLHTKQLSALCWCFNTLWAEALNDKTFDYFLLLHADIIPVAPQRWITKLIGEAERAHADLLSVVAPLKAPHGFTSTALVSDAHPQYRRLTMTELAQLPETFRGADLARVYGWENEPNTRLWVNTGCMLADLRHHRDAWEEMYFKMIDKVERQNGKFVATFQPEDWDFSEQAHARGLAVAATKAITLLHHGATDYRNDTVWGTQAHDV